MYWKKHRLLTFVTDNDTVYKASSFQLKFLEIQVTQCIVV